MPLIGGFMGILAIDPGNEYSAYVYIDDDYTPTEFGKIKNEELRSALDVAIMADAVAIEMIASYGMGVGQSVFDTCVWIGRFVELITQHGVPITYIFRKDEKMNLCHSMKAKDSNIRLALIDRFAKHDKKNGKGTKDNPDFFYGFKADIWAAYAVGVTYLDMNVIKNS